MEDLYTLTFKITGKKIQKSGFRSAIEELALDLEITGSAKNRMEKDASGLMKYSVEVTAEGTKENLRKFIGEINKINTFHVVNPVDGGKVDSANRNETNRRIASVFTIEREGDHVGERMDEAAYYMKGMSKDMKGMRGDMGVVSTEIKDMRGETHGNFQTMEKRYHNISNKLNLFVDIVAEYVKSEKSELRETIDALREQYRD